MNGSLPLGDSEIAEIYNVVAFRQRSLNRICAVKRIARQLRPKQQLNNFSMQQQLKKGVVTIKVSLDRIVESTLAAFRNYVGSLVPFQIVFSGSKSQPTTGSAFILFVYYLLVLINGFLGGRKNSFEEFFLELPKSNFAEKRGLCDAWLPRMSMNGRVPTTELTTLGYILLRSVLEDRPLTDAISLPVFKYILRGSEAALSALVRFYCTDMQKYKFLY